MSLCVSLLLLEISLFFASALGHEVQALLAFKSSITADPFGVLKDWIPNSPNPCNWTGIYCSYPFVQVIELSDYHLEGHISPFIGNLSYLRRLNLSFNHLHGSIPASFENLSKLQSLSLSSNALTGSIPSFQNHSFRYLNLSYNLLSDDISSFQNMSFDILDLSHNSLSGVIPPFQNMSFVILDLSHNHLSGVIPFFQNMVFDTLDLSHNNLRGVIPSFQNLSLYSLDLSHNRLSGAFFPFLESLSWLYFLDLSHNLLNSTIPSAPGSLTGCYLDLSSNMLTGIIPYNLYTVLLDTSQTYSRNDYDYDFCRYNFSGNALSGVVPSWVASTTHFQLDLSYNDLEGSVPCTDNSTTVILNGNSRLHYNCTVSNKAIKNGLGKGKGRGFIFIFGVVSGGFAGVCLLWFFLLHGSRSPRNKKVISWVDPEFVLVSEQELAVATNNFSEHNLVGTGGSACVYRGVLPSSECVAVKVFYGLDLQEEDDDEQRAAAETRFMRECRTLGQIRHRNLVKIITTCCGENIRALILQFMPNGNLHELLHVPSRYRRLMPLSLKTRLLLVKDIACALSYLHNDCCPSIIHCDVKPHNVLLNEDMTACLSDFGMAKILQPPDIAPSLRLEGSVGYIAPEYGTGVEPWSRGDVYSFGVVMLEVLTRTRPTDEETLGEQRLSKWVSMTLMQGIEHWYSLICGREGQHEISALSNADIKVLEELLKIGVWCCCQEPHARPTMREVEELLCKLCVEVVVEGQEP